MWLKVTILSLGVTLHYSIILNTSTKAAIAQHAIIQKEVGELSAKGAIEPSAGGADFYSNVFAVLKHTGGLQPILNLKKLNCYMHIPTYKILAIRKVGQLSQQGDYAFSIDLKVAYLHIPIVKHHHCLLPFVWQHNPYQWKVLTFGPASAPKVFTSLTKPILFLSRCNGFCVYIYLDDILVLTQSKHAGKRAKTLVCSTGLSWILPSMNFISLNTFLFWTISGYSGHVCIFAICQIS